MGCPLRKSSTHCNQMGPENLPSAALTINIKRRHNNVDVRDMPKYIPLGMGICPVCFEITWASYCQDPNCKNANPLRYGDSGYRRLAHMRNARRAIQWRLNKDRTSWCRATSPKAKELAKEVEATGKNHLVKEGYIYWLIVGPTGKRFVKRYQQSKH